MQERERAATEIARLRNEVERLTRQRRTQDTSRSLMHDPSPTNPVPNGTLVRLNTVCELVGVSRSTIYKWIAEGRFPAAIQVGARAMRWRIEEIRAWQASL